MTSGLIETFRARAVQISEDIGYGMILPLSTARREKEMGMLIKGVGIMTTGFLTNIQAGAFNISSGLITLGACILGSLVAEYQEDGENIRKKLDTPHP